MRKIEISVDADQNIVKIFKILKQFEPNIELGLTMKAIREQTPVLYREFGGINSEDQFRQFLAFIDALSSAGIRITLTQFEFQPRTSMDDQPNFLKSIINRDAISILLEKAAADAEERRQHAARTQAWLLTEEGQRHIAYQKRLNKLRDTFESRWKKLGNDHLAEYEREYLSVWCLRVEVNTGGFHQYFWNSAGDDALQALSALETISAINAQNVLSEALNMFEDAGGFQVDRAKRIECLAMLPDSVFSKLNERFYNLDEDIDGLALLHIERGYYRDAITVEEEE